MILLVRHGEATHHTEHLTGGWTDSELTNRGKEQMRLLAARLAFDFAGRSQPVIYASDLRRAAVSAEIIGQALGGVPVLTYRFLREKNNGKAAGMKEEEARKYYRMIESVPSIDHVNYVGGESRRSFFERNVKGFQALDVSKNTIIVAHKGTIQNIVFAWLGMDIAEVAKKNFSVDISPASLTVLGVNKWHEHALFLLNAPTYLGENKGMGIFSYR